MKRHRAARLSLGASLFSLVLASVAVAQTPPPPSPGGTPPPPQRPAAPGGDRPSRGDPSQFVDVLMAGDRNNDGKLTTDELPEGLGTRLMEGADANKDGAIDRAELTAFAQSQQNRARQGDRPQGEPGGERGPGQRGPRGGGAPQSLEGAMKQANRAFKALKGSAFDASSRQADLDAVQALQSALVTAKGMGPMEAMPASAKEKFGDDRTAYVTAFRRQMLKAISDALAIEVAVLDGKGADAKAAIGRLEGQEEAGHKLFAEEEEESKEGAAGGGGGR